MLNSNHDADQKDPINIEKYSNNNFSNPSQSNDFFNGEITNKLDSFHLNQNNKQKYNQETDLTITLGDIQKNHKEQKDVNFSPFHLSFWLLNVYILLSKKKTIQKLTYSQLQQRFIDPESPVWYSSLFLEQIEREIHELGEWNLSKLEPYFSSYFLELLDELLSSSTKHINQNLIYLKHNTAMLLFFIGRQSDALQFLDEVIEECRSCKLFNEEYITLQSICFIYLKVGKFFEASMLLSYLLKDKYQGNVRYFHSLYLCARLFDEYGKTILKFIIPQFKQNEQNEQNKQMSQLKQTNQLIQNEQIVQKNQVENTNEIDNNENSLISDEYLIFKKLDHFQVINESYLNLYRNLYHTSSIIMRKLIEIKPKNQLYKLWNTYWIEKCEAYNFINIKSSHLLSQICALTTHTLQVIALDNSNGISIQEQVPKKIETNRIKLYLNWLYSRINLKMKNLTSNPKILIFLKVISILISVIGFGIILKVLQDILLPYFSQLGISGSIFSPRESWNANKSFPTEPMYIEGIPSLKGLSRQNTIKNDKMDVFGSFKTKNPL